MQTAPVSACFTVGQTVTKYLSSEAKHGSELIASVCTERHDCEMEMTSTHRKMSSSGTFSSAAMERAALTITAYCSPRGSGSPNASHWCEKKTVT